MSEITDEQLRDYILMLDKAIETYEKMLKSKNHALFNYKGAIKLAKILAEEDRIRTRKALGEI